MCAMFFESVLTGHFSFSECKLPAEEIDRISRPGFITTNDAGIEVCENRLSYLVAKGAVLRKGQRLRSRFCKFSRSPTDCFFTAILYVSDDDKIFRYTDEGQRSFRFLFDPTIQTVADFSRCTAGEILELCRWRWVGLVFFFAIHAELSIPFFFSSCSRTSVDVSTLPSFQYHAQSSSGGFYTE